MEDRTSDKETERVIRHNYRFKTMEENDMAHRNRAKRESSSEGTRAKQGQVPTVSTSKGIGDLIVAPVPAVRLSSTMIRATVQKPRHAASAAQAPAPTTPAPHHQVPTLHTVHDYLIENVAVLGSLGGLAAALAIVPTFVAFPIANVVITSLLYILVVITIRTARSTIPPSAERTNDFDVFAWALFALQYILLFVGIIYYHTTYRFLLPAAVAMAVTMWSFQVLGRWSWYHRPLTYLFQGPSRTVLDRALKVGVGILVLAPYWITCGLTAILLPQINLVLDIIQVILTKAGR